MTSLGPAVLVVGGGVIGLTTAVVLAESGYGVTLASADPPERTTSAAAGALVGLAFVEPVDRVRRWDEVTTQVMTELGDDPTSGVHLTRCLFAAREPTPVPPPITGLPGFATVAGAGLPSGFAGGFWLTMPVVDMSRYLPYLVQRLRAAGAMRALRRVDRLADVLGEADAVVNCSGFGARDLADDPSVVPSRGQHVIVTNPGIDTMFMEGPPGKSEWVAWMPHGDRIVIGGVTQPGRIELEPDLQLAGRLLDSARRLNPDLQQAEVIGHQVGLRPERPAVRVDVEHCNGTPVVHNYGHGGVGVTLSWGCAYEVRDLLGPLVQPD